MYLLLLVQSEKVHKSTDREVNNGRHDVVNDNNFALQQEGKHKLLLLKVF